ncbi:MAG: 30S ribosomal protein S18 [bacterium]
MDCYFCKQNIKEVNFENTDLLSRFISGLGKIKARKRTGLCAKHQKMMARAIKRARHLGILSPSKK